MFALGNDPANHAFMLACSTETLMLASATVPIIFVVGMSSMSTQSFMPITCVSRIALEHSIHLSFGHGPLKVNWWWICVMCSEGLLAWWFQTLSLKRCMFICLKHRLCTLVLDICIDPASGYIHMTAYGSTVKQYNTQTGLKRLGKQGSSFLGKEDEPFSWGGSSSKRGNTAVAREVE